VSAAPSRPGLPAITLALSVVLCAFTLSEVNYPRLGPQSQLAIFAMLGLVLCFLNVPAAPRLARSRVARFVDRGLALLAVACTGFIVWQTEPLFAASWLDGRSLGNRAGYETPIDIAVGIAGLLLVIEAARRTLGLALPLLAGAFVAYAYFGASLPDWLFPHRGYPVNRIVAQTFLHSQGVFGVALSVMFTYVFLFVIFGAVLAQTGATQFIIGFAARTFGRSPGGPAKVAVLSSGFMGSLSGSAVANVATTGTFTIPMMRSAGFEPRVAAGIEAAASSGGALVPPVMGAGAYMMLEIVQPPVTYLEIIRAALIPAVLYYLSLFLIVHFYARRLTLAPQPSGSDDRAGRAAVVPDIETVPWHGVVFGTALISLVVFLLLGYTAFRAVTIAIGATLAIGLWHPATRITGRGLGEALVSSARDVVPLIAAAASVGIIIGTVTLTGIGTRLPAAIMPMAEESLLLALVFVMIASLILGMGLPSAVTYLLLATLVGPALGQLGAVPLAAHLFIFYFGLMSMVTPPVALAAYAAASIAGSNIMRTGITAFRFALVGFTLPFIFVFRPQLLMLHPEGTAAIGDFVEAFGIAALGVTTFAAGIGGCLFTRTRGAERLLLFLAAALLLIPGPGVDVWGVRIPALDVGGGLVALAAGVPNWRRNRAERLDLGGPDDASRQLPNA